MGSESFGDLAEQVAPAWGQRGGSGRLRLPTAGRGQVALRAACLDDLVAADRLVWRFVEQLDPSPLDRAIEAVEGRPGHPPTARRVLWRRGCMRRWRGSPAPRPGPPVQAACGLPGPLRRGQQPQDASELLGRQPRVACGPAGRQLRRAVAGGAPFDARAVPRARPAACRAAARRVGGRSWSGQSRESAAGRRALGWPGFGVHQGVARRAGGAGAPSVLPGAARRSARRLARRRRRRSRGRRPPMPRRGS
jgi:hypothetical protein